MSKKYIIKQSVFPRSTELTLTWSTEADSLEEAMENVEYGEDRRIKIRCYAIG